MGIETAKELAGTVVIAISGMTCEGCASTVSRVLSRVPGVTGARVDLASGRAEVRGTARAEDLTKAVEAAGFTAQPA